MSHTMKTLLLLLVAALPAFSQSPVLYFSDETDAINQNANTGANANGSPVCIFGRNFGATRGSSTISVGGVQVAQYLDWSDTLSTQAGVPPAKACFVLGASIPTGARTITLTTASGTSGTLPLFVRSSGSVWYVNTAANGGSDSNDGKSPTVTGGHGPWASPQGCVAFTSANSYVNGDKCVIMPGRYTQVNSGRGGPIAINGGGGVDVTHKKSILCWPVGGACDLGTDYADGNNADGYAFLFDGGAGGGLPYWTVAGLKVHSNGAPFQVQNSTLQFRAVNNEITCPYCDGLAGIANYTQAINSSQFLGNYLHDGGTGIPATSEGGAGPFTINGSNNSLTITTETGTETITLASGTGMSIATVAADINGKTNLITVTNCAGRLVPFSNGVRASPPGILAFHWQYGGCASSGGSITQADAVGTTTGGSTSVLFSGTARATLGFNSTKVSGGPIKTTHGFYLGSESSQLDVGWNSILNNDVDRGIQVHSSPASGIQGLPMCNLYVHDNYILNNGGAAFSMGSVDPSCQAESSAACQTGTCTGIRFHNNVAQNVGLFTFNNNGGGALSCFNGPGGADAGSESTMTGTWSGTSGSTTITGSGTLFLSQLKVGWSILDSTHNYQFEISAITDNTHLTVVVAPALSVSGTQYYIQGIGNIEIYNNTCSNVSANLYHDGLGVRGVVDRQSRAATLLIMDMKDNIFTSGTSPVDGVAPYYSQATLTCPGSFCGTPYIRDTNNLWYGNGAYVVLPSGNPGVGNSNPLFNSSTDLRPAAGSPTLSAGYNTGVSPDVLGVTRSVPYTIGAYQNAAGCAITLSGSGPFTVGQVISFTATAVSCGAGTLTWTSSGLPTGASGCNSVTGASCAVTGTLTASAVFSASISVTDGGSNSSSASPSITVNPAPTITTSSPLGSGTQESAYSQTLTTTGGTGAATCAITSGSLIGSGLTLNAPCTISGTAGTPATYSFTATATDANGVAGAGRALSVTINPGSGAGEKTKFTGKATGGGKLIAH